MPFFYFYSKNSMNRMIIRCSVAALQRCRGKCWILEEVLNYLTIYKYIYIYLYIVTSKLRGGY